MYCSIEQTIQKLLSLKSVKEKRIRRRLAEGPEVRRGMPYTYGHSRFYDVLKQQKRNFLLYDDREGILLQG